MRLLFPILIILISGGIFYLVINPILNDPLSTNSNGDIEGGINFLVEQKKIIQTSLDDAQNLKEKIAELTARMNSISQADLQRLDNFLPDSVSEVQLVTDINNIAKSSALTIDQVTVETSKPAPSIRQSSLGTNLELASLSVSFQTTGTYSQVRSFMQNVARSLRVLDISNFSFSVNPQDGGRHIYNITLTTYWLK